MSRFYENQFKTRFYGVTMKLSLLLIALLVGYSTTYAQSGRTVTVSNDNELIEAKANPEIGTIVFEAGFYKHYNNFVQEGTMIFPENTRNQEDCEFFIVPSSVCLFVGAATTSFTAIAGVNVIGPECDVDEDGEWTVVDSPTGSNVTIESPNNYTTQVIVDMVGTYVMKFTWFPGSGAIDTDVQTSYRVRSEPEILSFTAPDVCGTETDVTLNVDFGGNPSPLAVVNFTLSGGTLPVPVNVTPAG